MDTTKYTLVSPFIIAMNYDFTKADSQSGFPLSSTPTTGHGGAAWSPVEKGGVHHASRAASTPYILASSLWRRAMAWAAAARQ